MLKSFLIIALTHLIMHKVEYVLASKCLYGYNGDSCDGKIQHEKIVF